MSVIEGILLDAANVDKPALRQYLAAREVVSVLDDEFGAVADGVADDRAAIQAAIDLVNPNNSIPAGTGTEVDCRVYGGTVYIPKGKYRYTDTLWVPPQVILEGEGARAMFDYDYVTGTITDIPGATLYYDPTTVSHAAVAIHGFVTATGAYIAADGTADSIVGSAFISGTYRGSQGAGLRNLAIVSDDTTARLAVSMLGGMLAEIENVLIRRFKSGIRARAAWMSTFEGIYIHEFDTLGIHLFDLASSPTLNRGWIHSGGTAVTGATCIELGYVTMSISGFQLEQAGVGVKLRAYSNVTMSGVTWDGVGTAIYLQHDENTRFSALGCGWNSTVGAYSGGARFLNATGGNPDTVGLINNLSSIGLPRVVGENISGGSVSLDIYNTAPGASEDLSVISASSGIRWHRTPLYVDYTGTGQVVSTRHFPDAASSLRENWLFNASGYFLLHNTNGLAIYDYAGGNLKVLLRADEPTIVLGSGVKIHEGFGSPEGAYTAPGGSVYARNNGGASTTFYVKESGTGNTGWRAL